MVVHADRWVGEGRASLADSPVVLLQVYNLQIFSLFSWSLRRTYLNFVHGLFRPIRSVDGVGPRWIFTSGNVRGGFFLTSFLPFMVLLDFFTRVSPRYSLDVNHISLDSESRPPLPLSNRNGFIYTRSPLTLLQLG